jgi:hypothetical protein
MKSNYFLSKEIIIITLNPKEISQRDFGVVLLELAKRSNITNIIFDLSLLEIIITDDIHLLIRLVNMLKLNNIKVIVTNFNIYSASILFHFIDEIPFQTALDVQSAIDVITNK